MPCGYDPLELWPVQPGLARAALGIDAQALVLLQVGRLVPRKGMDVSIRALRLLRDRYCIRARLLIVGGESSVPDCRLTPEIGRLEQLALSQGVADQVTFVGCREREALKYYYSAADIFVSTPWYEPFGLTPVEAMACGTPVIGSNVGGIKYTVLDGDNGYLVSPNDPAALAERVAYLHTHPAIRHALGARCCCAPARDASFSCPAAGGA